MPSWPSGIGQSLGDALVTGKPLLTSYTAYFVSSVTGNTAYSGLDPDVPKATIAQAIATASGASVTPIIVCLSGHTEVLTTTMTPAAGTILVGAGASGGLPTVKLAMNASNTTYLTCSNAGVQVRNIWFQANQQSSNVSKVKFTGINGYISGCYFEENGNDTAAGLEFGTGGSGGFARNCTFISTATAQATLPSSGLLVSAALTDIAIEGCSFSEGTYGYSTQALSFTATVTRLRGELDSLLLGANATLGATTGIFMPTTVTGAGTISYTGGG